MSLRDRIDLALAVNQHLALDRAADRKHLVAALLSALDEGFAELVLDATRRALGSGTPVLAEMAALLREQSAPAPTPRPETDA